MSRWGREQDWRRTIRVPPRIVVFFTRQLATMVRTAIPIVPALESLSRQAESPEFTKVVTEVTRLVANGQSFSESLAHFPLVFPRFYWTMVAVGENTGQMDESLEILAGWLERDHSFRARVKSALIYPVFILALALTLTMALFQWVLPSFLQIFSELKVDLPAPTKVLMAITEAVRNPVVWVIGIVVLGFIGQRVKAYARTQAGSAAIFGWLSFVPVLGTILTASTTARYSSAMAALLSNGTNLTKALPLAALVSENPLLKLDSVDLVWNMINGESLTAHMRSEPDVYEPILVQLVAVGEETSDLEGMYAYTAQFFDMQTSTALDGFAAAIEPLLLAFVAVVVGFIMISLFLPMYSFLNQIG
jgi:type II secretory pathway component PulF